MKHLVDLLCLCLLCLTGKTLCDKNGPTVITVKEGRDAILPCRLWPKVDLTSERFIWRKYPKEGGWHKTVFLYNGQRVEVEGQDEQFQGRVEYFPEEVKEGNASIIIRKTTKADSGKYVCIYLDYQMFCVDLVVASLRRCHSAPDPKERPLMMT
ncbi:butyrophilin subfamily 2 member A2-like [Etheostoma cragini]|uniref:butyrophilin subfamily 2 member A2-like n=1 Tax=Etheostoma cragini TaxID=417921 RepID=UPI00155DF292|nr:butyrophilin subfamily 2 member A2-like [Etheostoma cragini]